MSFPSLSLSLSSPWSCRSGVIWQVERKKGHWKTLNTSVIALLEEASLAKSHDLKLKDLEVVCVIYT